MPRLLIYQVAVVVLEANTTTAIDREVSYLQLASFYCLAHRDANHMGEFSYSAIAIYELNMRESDSYIIYMPGN